MKIKRRSDDPLKVSDFYGKKTNLASSTGYYKRVQVLSKLQKGKENPNDKEFTHHIQILTQECVWQELGSIQVSNQTVNLPDIVGHILVFFPPQAQP